MTIKDSVERIQKIDTILSRIPLVPVVSLIGYKKLKEEKDGLIYSIVHSGKVNKSG